MKWCYVIFLRRINAGKPFHGALPFVVARTGFVPKDEYNDLSESSEWKETTNGRTGFEVSLDSVFAIDWIWSINDFPLTDGLINAGSGRESHSANCRRRLVSRKALIVARR